MNIEIDIRHALPAIHVPTLILHRTGDLDIDVRGARYMAERIPEAKYVEFPGDDHLVFAGDQDVIIDEIELFLTGECPAVEPNRMLTTILVTDIVGSTEHAAALGDHRWRDLLAAHDAATRREFQRHRGIVRSVTGDGFLATFDGPARAIRCARAIQESLRPLGITVRAGLHTGECELIDDQVTGIALYIAARVVAVAGADETVVSSTVKDLVAGAGNQFEDRGRHTLRGVPGLWQLYAVV